MVSDSEREIGALNSNSIWMHYIHFHINALRKRMNLSLLQTLMAETKVSCLEVATSLGVKKTLNSKPFMWGMSSIRLSFPRHTTSAMAASLTRH